MEDNSLPQDLSQSPPLTIQPKQKINKIAFYGIAGTILLILCFSVTYILSVRNNNTSHQIAKSIIIPTATLTSVPTLVPSLTPTIVLPTLTLVSGWKNYQNAQYGFTLNYPNSVKLYETPGQIQTFIPMCNETSLITCLFISPNLDNYPNFRGASIAINVVKKDEFSSQDIKTEADCKQYFDARTDQATDSTRQINGTLFYYGTFGQGATGHLISEQHFGTYDKNDCFYIQLCLTYDDVNPPFFTQEDTLFTQLNKIFSTFRFTNK